MDCRVCGVPAVCTCCYAVMTYLPTLPTANVICDSLFLLCLLYGLVLPVWFVTVGWVTLPSFDVDATKFFVLLFYRTVYFATDLTT